MHLAAVGLQGGFHHGWQKRCRRIVPVTDGILNLHTLNVDRCGGDPRRAGRAWFAIYGLHWGKWWRARFTVSAEGMLHTTEAQRRCPGGGCTPDGWVRCRLRWLILPSLGEGRKPATHTRRQRVTATLLLGKGAVKGLCRHIEIITRQPFGIG